MIIIIAIIIILWLLSCFTTQYGDLVVSMDDELETKGLLLSETKDFADPQIILSGERAEEVYHYTYDWVEAIEDAIPYIDKAIREQRRFIIQNEDIVPIEKARKITSESVRHLAQHTNLIARVEGDDVTPERILDIQREESFAIYENRFLRTLLVHASRFVDDRYKEMKHAPNVSYQKIHISRSISLNHQKLDFELTYANESHEEKDFDINADISTLTDFQRVRRLRRVLADFSASALIRALTNTEMVRPPIQRTNLMTKNPNFKKALDLYLFITSYKKTGFEIVGKEYSGKMDEEVQLAMYNVMSYQHFVVSIATNPALRRLLHEKYLEENARLETEALRPEEQILAETEKRIAQVRAEEAQIRLDEIKDREKQINDLNSQLNHAKFTLRQNEAKMTEMRGLINLHETTIQQLKDQIFELEKENKVLADKVEELTAIVSAQQATISAQNAEIAELKAQIEAKSAEIQKHLETIAAAREAVEKLTAQCEQLNTENTALKSTVAAQEDSIASLTAELEKTREELYKCAEEIGILRNSIAEKDAALEKNRVEISALSMELGTVKTQFEDAKAQHIQETESLKKAHEEDKEQLYLNFKQQTEAAKSAHAKEISKLIETHNASVEDLNSKHKAEVSSLTAEHQAEAQAAAEKHSAEVSAMRQDYEGKITTLTEDSKSKLAQAAAGFEAKMALEAQRQQTALSKRDEQHASEIQKLQQSFDTERKSYLKQLEDKEKDAKKQVSAERARFDKELDKKQKEYDKLAENIRREAKAEIERARRQAELQAKAQAKKELEDELARLAKDEQRQETSKHIGSKRFGIYFHKK